MVIPTELQRLVMGGVEVHLESLSETVRGMGMVVGEVVLERVMGEGPKFQYTLSEEMQELQRLARWVSPEGGGEGGSNWSVCPCRPVEEQERELKERELKERELKEYEVRGERGGEDVSPSPERLGEGLAHVTECSDSDRYVAIYRALLVYPVACPNNKRV